MEKSESEVFIAKQPFKTKTHLLKEDIMGTEMMEVEKLKAEDGNITFKPLTKQSLKNKAKFTAGRTNGSSVSQLHNTKLH